MALPGAQKRNRPRKSALAKAALRKAGAGGSRGEGHKPASKAELVEALANRPKVDFDDPFMRHAAMQAKGISLCAFLVSLAAFQRGLKVTFHYERASFDPRFAKARMQGHRGELFSISNGARTHVFSRTLGDLTDPAANAVAEDKHLTKIALRKAGIQTPHGIVVDKEELSQVDAFLNKHRSSRFVVKPIAGSLSDQVDANLAIKEVYSSLAAKKEPKLILERYVAGPEYRVFVVSGRCVAISLRNRPCVLGDGSKTIRSLLAEQQIALATRNPFWSSFASENEMQGFLSRNGLSLDSVPTEGEVVFVSNTSECPFHEDVTETLLPQISSVAAKATKAVGLPVCGVDLIVEPCGAVVVLELNQRAHIGMHSFPYQGVGQGNAVAEAIVDHYFPETIHDRTHPTLAYDFAPIRAALESAQISELSLPVIGPDWHVLRFVETGIAAKAMAKLIETAARTTGVFVMSAPAAKGGVELCLAYAPTNWRAFLNVIPAQFRARLEQRAAGGMR